jgi:ABC-2 type transport system ATP-binding protein
VRTVEVTAPNRFRLLADHDVRPQAAAAVVASGGRLLQLSDLPSLEMIYTQYFQNQAQGERRHAA